MLKLRWADAKVILPSGLEPSRRVLRLSESETGQEATSSGNIFYSLSLQLYSLSVVEEVLLTFSALRANMQAVN